ncbi:Fur family transcriptional regulator [Aliarcobacter cryaerophilus]|jgi:Fur family ferric uptake transcriptional regulator|uniref:Ferric uptake regulation protein n=2 Tax=Arcobacteraceae TaxID=2808963 RepID=A0AAU0P225_9BACT|nr:Fur family transcriptional regulator [Aliarcobacter cryaerophilus]WNL17648.1 Fur family transcriptional regulator [Arcobacter sp. AZ-2023]WPD02624.1 Fur family transcriptional regulator [Arcobacter sp. DSM 115972]MCT7468698.1 transcriptional repressor [Aliarcobacter cryaerophilus]MCT7483166.1 transcriptional repressor [Aliarcobacter cryaerophilus]MCT7511177.1 transcriptional repressor [Aliarcobacter cryaerophilus]
MLNNYEEIIEELKKIVKQKGLKYTEQREIVLSILLHADGHLTAEEVYNQIKKDYPNSNVGIATVYRALSFLEEVELIASLNFGVDGKKYESNIKSHHDHLICTDCGKIVEFVDEEIEKRQEKIAKANKFKITDHSMQLYGICESCQ